MLPDSPLFFPVQDTLRWLRLDYGLKGTVTRISFFKVTQLHLEHSSTQPGCQDSPELPHVLRPSIHTFTNGSLR